MTRLALYATAVDDAEGLRRILREQTPSFVTPGGLKHWPAVTRLDALLARLSAAERGDCFCTPEPLDPACTSCRLDSAEIERGRAEARAETLQDVHDAAQEVERILSQSGVTDSRIADLRSALARAALAGREDGE